MNGLKNGDIVELDCDNAVLKKLGYTFEPTINIGVNGLSESIPEENYETESTSETSTENKINIAYSPDEIPTDIKEDIFTYLDNVVLITPADLDNLEIKGDYSDKEVTLFVYSEENFEKAKEYALKNNNIDIIQYNNKEYLKEDDFSEGRE